eukprot:174512-Hanusia_phi.AAC.3
MWIKAVELCEVLVSPGESDPPLPAPPAPLPPSPPPTNFPSSLAVSTPFACPFPFVIPSSFPRLSPLHLSPPLSLLALPLGSSSSVPLPATFLSCAKTKSAAAWLPGFDRRREEEEEEEEVSRARKNEIAGNVKITCSSLPLLLPLPVPRLLLPLPPPPPALPISLLCQHLCSIHCYPAAISVFALLLPNAARGPAAVPDLGRVVNEAHANSRLMFCPPPILRQQIHPDLSPLHTLLLILLLLASEGGPPSFLHMLADVNLAFGILHLLLEDLCRGHQLRTHPVLQEPDAHAAGVLVERESHPLIPLNRRAPPLHLVGRLGDGEHAHLAGVEEGKTV